MKKTILVSGIVFFTLLFFSQGLWAQRIYRDDPRAADPYNSLNLTQAQMEKIDKIDLELENELSPIYAKLRLAYFELEELEIQKNTDNAAIDKKWDLIEELETEIQNREALYDEKILSLLTTEQQQLLDSYYYCPRQDLYGRGGLGQGYYGRGGRGYGRGYYANGRNRTSYGMGSGYIGRGTARLGANRVGVGRLGANRVGVGRLGTGRLGTGYYNNYSSPRIGRGPCGAGLGRWYRWDNRRGRRY